MKRIVLPLMALALFFVMVILPSGVKAAEKEIRLASWGSKDHFAAVELGKWISDVNAALTGKYKVVNYPDGQLYGAKEMHLAVSKGMVDMGVVLLSRMISTVPLLQGAYLPFGFGSIEETARAYSGESMEILDKALGKNHIKVIFVSFLEPVQLFSKTANIQTLEGFKGLKVLNTSPMVTEILKSVGAISNTSIQSTEHYTALKRGLADATFQGSVAGYFTKISEVAPHVTKMNLTFPVIFVAMNMKKWDSLSEEVQNVMIQAGKAYQGASIEIAKAWDGRITGMMTSQGATVTTLPEEERSKIVSIAKKIWEKWAQKNGPDARRLLELNTK